MKSYTNVLNDAHMYVKISIGGILMELIDKKVSRIHNYIYANEGLGNEDVLNEFLKIFYCKILDEQEGNLFSKDTSSDSVLDRVDKLYEEYKERLKGIVDSKEKINLRKETILYIISELKDVKFSAVSSDTKGHILQRIIDRSYRENRGQFFTPAPVVDFVVKMINPKKGEKGCDPASGTGGFMFKSLEHVSESSKIAKNDISNVFFYDISKSLIRLIAMRMMFEFSYNEPNFAVRDSIAEEYDLSFDFVLTNPPFGSQGKIMNSKILKKYSLGLDDKGNVLKAQVPDILFVEKVIKILKDGGRGAVVLPDGDFENPSQEYFRKYLIDHVKIDAVISLPDGTFIPYGTGVKSSIVFFTKMSTDELKKAIDADYDVFYGRISKLGYSFSKHSKDLYLPDGSIDEDYNKIIDCYQKKHYDDNAHLVKISEIISSKNILSESFYSPAYERVIDEIKSGKYEKMVNLVSFNYKKEKINKESSYNYVEIADVNSYTGEIINCSELVGEDLPSRASYKITEGDIIVATSGNSIGTHKQSKALVTKAFDGSICTNGFTVMRATKISPYYLLYFLNSKNFLDQVLKYKYGTAIPCIGRDDFENILVPILSADEMNKIESRIKKAIELRKQALELMQEQ